MPFRITLVVISYAISTFFGTLNFTNTSAFNNRISDPSVGASYLTILNSIANLGKKISIQSTLFL